MKPQKKAVVARKSAATPNTAKKRRASPEKVTSDPPKRDKKTEDKKGKRVDVVLTSARKSDKSEDVKKKIDKSEDKRKGFEKVEDKKKIEKIEERKKVDKVEERKRIANDKPAEERRNGLLEKIEELKKCEELKKKMEKFEDKKKQNKDNEKKQEKAQDKVVEIDCKRGDEDKFDKKTSLEEFGKEEKTVEDNSEKLEKKNNNLKATKKGERKKSPEKENGGKKSSPSSAKGKKDAKPKQPRRKAPVKRTILAKKLPVSKKLLQTKIKLVKKLSNDDSKDTEEPGERVNLKKSKKKSSTGTKTETNDKKPQLGKQMKSKVVLRKCNPKIGATVTKKEEKMIKLAEKMVAKKNNTPVQPESVKLPCNNDSITGVKTAPDELDSKNIKREMVDSNEDCLPWHKSVDGKKCGKNNSRIRVAKKPVRKLAKSVKSSRTDNSNRNSSTSDEVTLEDLLKQSKPAEESQKLATGQSKQENCDADSRSLGIDLKVETDDKDDSSISSTSDGDDDENDGDGDEDNDDQDDEKEARNKRRNFKKRDRKSSSSDASSERTRRMRLFGFWSGPKRHRVASLNALAKVHCLYENEAGGVYLGGYCKPKPDKDRQPKKAKEEKEKDKEKENKEKENKEKDINKEKEKDEAKEREKKVDTKTKVEEISPKRKLRNVPGLRGKHWDMMESSSSSSSSDEEQRVSEERKNAETGRKKVTKRRKKNEEVMDLKDMVVCKRMASLNASAILAASYSDEKYHCRGSSSSDSSSESEVEVVRRRKQSDSEAEKRRARQGSDPEEAIKQPKKVVILNQDTDVTITGVYVNQTRSTHHEGFCSIAGMQYRISSTSHTQTAATAVATEIHEHPKPEQPCKSYTPLGALSSMQPPGSQGPPHPPMSPRRHSAFSAPHQHGYYQPAGPLIQHPPTLPPVKGPPPEPTPTPPQNSEGSDDLVATSTTSGGTTSGGAGGGSFYRAYCPQYYGTPPQYQELCYPPTYSHPHSHPPPYYKYAPTYRRQYYGYQESTGPGSGGPGSGGGPGGGPGVVEYQPPPPPPAEYPPPPYYGGYPPPPPPPPPSGNPAYMHPQGRPFVDHAAFQGCPCPMQSCPKNVDTGPLIGNGKGAPVGSGPGLSLPPSTLVGPPSPARGLAGLAPPHGAIAWDTDRVQINNCRNITLNQSPPSSQRNINAAHNHTQNQDCRTMDEKSCQNNEMSKCNCQKHACTSTCEVKTETLSPNEKLSAIRCPNNKLPNFKVENNNVKCESCSEDVSENIPCEANCNVKYESGYRCEILECQQCVKGQMAILDIDKDSGILLIDEKLESDSVKEELNDVLIDNENWKKPDYESTVQETVEEKDIVEKSNDIVQQPKCQKLTKRKLSLDSLSDNQKKRKINKRTLSVGSARDLAIGDQSSKLSLQSDTFVQLIENVPGLNVPKKKYTKKEAPSKKRKSDSISACEPVVKKVKTSKSTTNVVSIAKQNASENSIMETISSVIEQSLQITQKNEQKLKTGELADKKKIVNLMSTMKRAAKKPGLHKTVPNKMSVGKVIDSKNGQSKNESEAIINGRSQESKLKLHDAKSKSKVNKNKILNAKSKMEDAKSKTQDTKLTFEARKQSETISKAKVSEVVNGISNCTDIRKPTLIKNRRKSTKKCTNKKACSKTEEILAAEENLALIRRPSLKPKWSNGWSWEGEPYEAKVYLTNEESAFRRCYASMRHVSGDVLKPRDCVLLKSGPRKADLPFVAKIAALWENPHDGEMMFSLLWYYRPEHTEQGRTQYDTEDEVFASRHRDANSVACIEDKCYVLTFNEYCRYRKDLRRTEEGLESPGLIVPPGDQLYPRVSRLPPIPVPADIVLFCRRVYDYRGKKLVKNPG